MLLKAKFEKQKLSKAGTCKSTNIGDHFPGKEAEAVQEKDYQTYP